MAGESRQAGALSQSGESLTAKVGGLDLGHDFADLSANGFDRGAYWASRYGSSLAKAWVGGYLEAVLDVAVGSSCPNYQLVFSHIPSGRDRHINDAVHGNVIVAVSGDSPGHFQSDSMLILASETGEAREDVVPPFMAFPCRVQVHPFKNRANFIGDTLVLGRIQATNEILGAGREGKVDQVGIGANCGGQGLIESVPEVVNGVPSEMPSSFGERLTEADLIGFVARQRVYINDVGCFYFFEDALPEGVKFYDIYLSLSQ